MTLCPIALMVGCRKCPVLELCPLKNFMGDYNYRKHEKTQATQDDNGNSSQEQKK